MRRLLLTLLAVPIICSCGGGGYTNNNGKDRNDRPTPGSGTVVNPGSQASETPFVMAKGCSTHRLHLSNTPVNLNLVTGILYPGQWRNPDGQARGDDYKSHGGFRFNDSYPSDITVTAPEDAKSVDGARYIQSGETQYYIDFVTACGIRYRFDHIKTLGPLFAHEFDSFPAPTESSASAPVPAIQVKAGQVIAGAVGMVHSPTSPKGETFVDFGVWDLVEKTAEAANPAFTAIHARDPSAMSGLCWLTMLPGADAARVQALPAASATGKESDYCS